MPQPPALAPTAANNSPNMTNAAKTENRPLQRTRNIFLRFIDSLLRAFASVSLRFMLGVEDGRQEEKLGQYVETRAAIQCAAHHPLFNSVSSAHAIPYKDLSVRT